MPETAHCQCAQHQNASSGWTTCAPVIMIIMIIMSAFLECLSMWNMLSGKGSSSRVAGLGSVPAFPMGVFTGRVFFFYIPQLYLWGSPFWVRFVCMWPFFFKSYHRGSYILSSWMVHAGCVSVAGIHLSRTWMSGSFESVHWNACVHRLDLGLYSHPKEFWGNGVRTHVNSKRKIPSARKILLRGRWNPWRCIRQDSRPNTLPTSYTAPPPLPTPPHPLQIESYQWLKTWCSSGYPAWRYSVDTGTGWPNVSVLWPAERASLINNFCLSVAASIPEIHHHVAGNLSSQSVTTSSLFLLESLENLLNQNIAESSHLEANINDNLQEKVANFMSCCCFQVTHIIIATQVHMCYHRKPFTFTFSATETPSNVWISFVNERERGHFQIMHSWLNQVKYPVPLLHNTLACWPWPDLLFVVVQWLENSC